MSGPQVSFVILTMGSRPHELATAIRSARAQGNVEVVVVFNGSPVDPAVDCDVALTSPENVGIPGGRNLGARAAHGDLVLFLDDDAHMVEPSLDHITAAFIAEPRLAVAALRLIDDDGQTPSAHNPRLGVSGQATAGAIATFLGGAAVIRRAAFDDAGGLFDDLVYAHEELDLAWRLHDRGWTIRYLPQVLVYHPKVSISRHDRGWWLTGRNRVWIARRHLPFPVHFVHVAVWLLLGLRRAPNAQCRRAYLAGWRAGWSKGVERRPIRWATVWKLTTLGRPPII